MASSQALDTERENALALSHDCPICGGVGMVTVYHPLFTGDSVNVANDGRRYPATVAADCRCAMGLWMRDRTLPEIQRRIPRVEDCVAGRSKWMLEPPEEVMP